MRITRSLIQTAIMATTALVIGLLVGRFLLNGGSPAAASHDHALTLEPTDGQSESWTCSMHPQIQTGESGDCPICGMDLIPVESHAAEDSTDRRLTLTESAKRLAQVETTPVVRGFPEARIDLVGALSVDETRTRSLSARFPARVEELYVNYTGIPVQAGQHLASVYSPELLTAQRELLSARQFDPGGESADAAREKLRLWGFSPERIEKLARTGEPSEALVIQSPASGIVMNKSIHEGDYVETGQPMFQIADLSSLWLELEAFESDLAWLRYGQEAAFTVAALPGERFTGTIVFIAPSVNPATRTISVRVQVPNPGARLKPGMLARATVHARIGQSGQVYAPSLVGKWISPMHPEVVKEGPGQCDVCGMDLVPAESLGYVSEETAPPPLLIPRSAILQTGRRSIVYVEVPDTAEPTYEGREVTLGPQAGDRQVILAGLDEGERVVTRGAFRIDSSLQIQARPSMMSFSPERGTHAPGGAGGGHSHGHSSHDPSESVRVDNAEADSLGAAELNRIVALYLELQQALAGDDFSTAHAKAQALRTAWPGPGGFQETLDALARAEDLSSMRRPHFEDLSNRIIALTEARSDLLDTTLYRMNCPMVYRNRGADWLQASSDLLNPYFGASMLHCGSVVAVLNDSPSASGPNQAEGVHEH